MFNKLKDRQLNKTREMMHEQNVNISRDINYKKEPNRNSEAEKYKIQK